MANNRLLVAFLCCVGMVFSCQVNDDCESGHKCVYKSNSDPEEYTLCTSLGNCSCQKVCLHNGTYVFGYYETCNWCNCDALNNWFECTWMACPYDT